MSGDQLFPQRTPSSLSQDYARLSFVVQQLIGKLITIVPARVVAVTGSGSLTSCPYVTAQPLINRVTGNGVGVPHNPIHNIPCMRWQAGSAAIILDPGVGDVGLLLASYRDTSPLVAADQHSPGSLQGGEDTFNPASGAKYDWGSCFYLGGILNGQASQYIQLTESLCKIVAPTINLNGLTIDNSGNITSVGNVTANGNITATGDITAGQGGADSVTLQNHLHTSGSSGSPTSKPTAGT